MKWWGVLFTFFTNWNNYQRFQLSALCLLRFILFMPWSVSWKWNSFTNLVTALAEIKDKGTNIDTKGIRFAVKIIPQRKRERHLNMIVLNVRMEKEDKWFWCSKEKKNLQNLERLNQHLMSNFLNKSVLLWFTHEGLWMSMNLIRKS